MHLTTSTKQVHRTYTNHATWHAPMNAFMLSSCGRKLTCSTLPSHMWCWVLNTVHSGERRAHYYCASWTAILFEHFYSSRQSSRQVQQALPGQRVNGNGLWLNSLDFLPVCYTQCCMLTVLYVNSVLCCLLSVSYYNLNNSVWLSLQQRVQPEPNFESDSRILFSNSCFWWCYQKYLSEYN